MDARSAIITILTLIFSICLLIAGFLLIGRSGISLSFEDLCGLAMVAFALRELLGIAWR